MEHNPYAAPTVDVEGVPAASDLELATKGRRFANLIIDSLAYQFVLMVIAAGLIAIDSSAQQEVEDLSFLLTIGVMIGYYVVFEGLLGRTPGKFITGTRLVTQDGTAPSLRQVLVRSVSRLVPFEPFSCLGDPPEGWHDRWSGTYVVTTRSGPSRGPAYRLQNAGDSSGPRGLGL